MRQFFAWSMYKAPAILLAVSLIILLIGVVVAVMMYLATSAQVSSAPMHILAEGGYKIARIQLVSGVYGALQNACWPFAGAAIVYALQSRAKSEVVDA
ncbi:hypothetical protein ACG3SL_05080 [Sphingomonas sp. CJ20]